MFAKQTLQLFLWWVDIHAEETIIPIGQELPDKNSILTGLTIDFLEPSYINENLTFKAQLSFKSESTKALEFKYSISNRKKLLCKGKVNSIWRK